MNKVLRSFGFLPLETDLSQLDKFLDVVQNFVSSGDLLRKLPLVDHPPPPEQRKD